MLVCRFILKKTPHPPIYRVLLNFNYVEILKNTKAIEKKKILKKERTFFFLFFFPFLIFYSLYIFPQILKTMHRLKESKFTYLNHTHTQRHVFRQIKYIDTTRTSLRKLIHEINLFKSPIITRSYSNQNPRHNTLN